MAIKDEFAAELKDALTSGDKARAAVIRQVETEVSRAKSEPGFDGEVDDSLYVKVIGMEGTSRFKPMAVKSGSCNRCHGPEVDRI